MGHLTAVGDLTGIGRCPQCQIANPQLKSVWLSEPYPLPDNPIIGTVWAAYHCTSCTRIVLVECEPSVKGPHNWSVNYKVEKIYPDQRVVDETLPPMARTYLSQAHETLHAPDAAAVMAASAVDAMLKDKGYLEGSLYNRIDKAVEDHLLTEGMGKWAHAVRLEANNVRHADGESPHVTKPQAQRVVDFASALGDFLYVLTAKIEEGVKAADSPSKIVKSAGVING